MIKITSDLEHNKVNRLGILVGQKHYLEEFKDISVELKAYCSGFLVEFDTTFYHPG